MSTEPTLVVREQPPHARLSDYRLIAFDMDSTLITIECIDELADFAGLLGQRLGEMHNVLAAPTSNPDFQPEVTTVKDSQGWAKQVGAQGTAGPAGRAYRAAASGRFGAGWGLRPPGRQCGTCPPSAPRGADPFGARFAPWHGGWWSPPPTRQGRAGQQPGEKSMKASIHSSGRWAQGPRVQGRRGEVGSAALASAPAGKLARARW